MNSEATGGRPLLKDQDPQDSSAGEDYGPRFLAEQVKLIHSQGPTALLGAIACAVVLALVIWDVIPHSRIVFWLILVGVVSVLRYLFLIAYQRKNPGVDEALVWGRIFIAGSFSSGLVWGLAALILFPENSIAHQVFLTLMVGGLATGTMGTYTVMKWAGPAFFIPALSVLAGRFLYTGGEMHYYIGGILVVYTLLVLGATLRLHNTISTSLRLRFENVGLITRLAAANERFQKLSQASFEGIVIHDDGMILDANETMADMLGYKLSEAIGRNILDFIAQEERERVTNAITAGKEDAYETVLVKKDGTRLNVEVHGKPIPYHGRTVRVATVKDITARKEGERALKESEERFRELFENANDLVYIHDIEGRLTLVNKALANATGYFPEELKGMDINEIIAPGFRKQFRSMMERKIEGRQFTSQELDLIAKHGNRLTVEMHASLITKNEIPVGVQGIARDITQRKISERELKGAKVRAEEAIKFKDMFMSIVAHDMRAPFTAIVGFLETLNDDKERPLSVSQKNMVNLILQSCDSMLLMLDELQDLSAIQTGMIKLEKEAIDARGLAEQTLAGIASLAQSKCVTLVNEVPAGAVVEADKRLYYKVIRNLAANAVKFCRRGDSITVFMPEGSGSAIAVADTGVGVKPGLAPGLFKHEIKTTAIGTNGETGTGFGLPFCHDVMKAHGGALDFESAEGKGSVFYARLPE